ncbi:MAG: transglutaminase-like domain-containing protein [Bacilli bacterium]|nr:transglutaminase-like domain-containing protein [Bacilli bacterium]
MSDAEKAQAISTYLYQNVARQLNQSTEAYKTNHGDEAYAALVMKIAACSGFCKAVTLLCDEAGLKSQHINAGLWTHQWNKIYVDGKWQVLDAQLGYFGGEKHPYLE